MISTLGRLMLPAAVSMGLLFAAGCDPGATITYVNETDQRVSIYLGDSIDRFDVSIAPHSKAEVGTIATEWRDVVVVRDGQENVILRKEITWDELKAEDFRFVITEEMLSPTPSASP